MTGRRLVLDAKKKRLLSPPQEPVLLYLLDEAEGERRFHPVSVFTPGVDDPRLGDAQKERRVTFGDLFGGLVTTLVGFVLVVLLIVIFAFMQGRGNSSVQSMARLGMLATIFGAVTALTRMLKDLFDKRRNVVLLRAHTDDALFIRKAFFDRERFGRRHLGDHTPIPFEEAVYAELQFHGPTFALSPQDSAKLRLERGMNYRFSHGTCPLEDWQQVIFYAIAGARLIAVILGSSLSLSDRRWGLAWELSVLRAVDCPEKVMMIIPPCGPDELAQRWAAFRKLAEELKITAPSELPEDTRVVLFSRDWVCEPAARNRPTLGGYQKAIKQSIHNVDARRSRIHRGLFGLVLGGIIGGSIPWVFSLFDPVATTSTPSMIIASLKSGGVVALILGALFFAPRSAV